MLIFLKKILKKIGPGFVTGAADDDPSGIATYSQTGSIFGFSQLWLALFSFPFMVVIQQMCGRIGMAITNTINIGADLGAMASSAKMLLGLLRLPRSLAWRLAGWGLTPLKHCIMRQL